ncbi:hypothetical protein EDB83DRAFT_2517907 [Lactarius deliciosus]|nr:hypothetical protein EDB83DRAFT_2517907 [Lactarius deliciosus]
MKFTLIITATSLLAAAAHGSVVKVESTGRATGSVQNPSGAASVSFSASRTSGTPGKQRESRSTGVHTLSIMSPQGATTTPWLREHAYHYLFDRVRPDQTELEWRPPSMISSGISSGTSSGLPAGTPLASTFTPKATYTTGGTVSA